MRAGQVFLPGKIVQLLWPHPFGQGHLHGVKLHKSPERTGMAGDGQHDGG
jgi:hypothetical protein